MAFDLSAIGAPLDTRYPNDLALQSIAALQSLQPSWIPRNASPEVIFIEAVALAVAELVNGANATIAAVEEDILATFYQVPRRPGTPAAGQITVTFDTTVTTVIPAGTGFSLSDYGIEVQTTADASVSAASSKVLDVATTEATTLVNGVGPGAAVDVLDVIPNILSVAVTAAFGGGADPEDNAAYTARARNRLARVTNSLVVPQHFSAYVLEDGRAVNALCIPAWDGASTGTIGTNAGHVAVVVYGRGATLSAADKADLAAAMQAITYAGATVHVVDAATTTVNVTTTVKAAPGYTASEVQAATGQAVATFLAAETWPIGDDVIRNQLQAAIIDIPQVDYIVAMSAPSGDTTIAANAVAKPGTVTVSVT